MNRLIPCLTILLLAITAAPSPADSDWTTDPPRNDADCIAAIVDDSIVTYSEINEQAVETVKVLQQNYTGTELNAKINEARFNVLRNLMARLLIIHEFRREGGQIPDSEIQGLINERIKDWYAGDADAFNKNLASHDETLDEYKEELNDNAIVAYMRNKYIVERVNAIKPANAYEKDALTKAISDSWINTLYSKFYFKNFMGVPENR